MMYYITGLYTVLYLVFLPACVILLILPGLAVSGSICACDNCTVKLSISAERCLQRRKQLTADTMR